MLYFKTATFCNGNIAFCYIHNTIFTPLSLLFVAGGGKAGNWEVIMFALLRILLTVLTYRESATSRGINSFQRILTSAVIINIERVRGTGTIEFCPCPIFGFGDKFLPFSFLLISCYSRLEGDRGAIPTLSMVSINLR